MRAIAATIYAEKIGLAPVGEDVRVDGDGLRLVGIILGFVILLCLLCISKHA